MRKLRWGILSTADIGLRAVIPALQASSNGEVVAVASRRLSKARAVAQELGIERALGSYDALLTDSDVEAVYNPLPNHLHVSWSIRALNAGKHVLCEKPIAMNAEEATELIQAAQRRPKLKVMEAFMYRFHPRWETIRGLFGEGGIGDLTTIYSTFTYYNVDPDDFRNIPAYGGGGLLDVGCYSISSSRWLFGSEPKRVFGVIDYDPTFGIDRVVSGFLDFGVGTATFTCSTQVPRHQRVEVYGTLGRIVIEDPFNPPGETPARARLQAVDDHRELFSPAVNQYTRMGEAFADAVLGGTDVPSPLEDALANMRVIDAVFESGRTGRWVAL